ncbi:MAG: tyrosine--tRNA ligase [Actinobacteria bacterium]|nr:MAG: tyrosine--tRNA ligase [Actinomycetota bacterium]
MESVKEQLDLIALDTEEVLPPAELKQKLEKAVSKNKPLNIKFGVDPTAPDLHLGHAVPLKKLKELQDLGHVVTLIIGDFTARIGDPSGRKATRPQLTSKEIEKNAKTYTDQAFKILDKGKTKVAFNSQWLAKMDFTDVLNLAGNFTIARLLERDDFSKRYKEGLPIGLHEFLYPVMQAIDSVEIKADIEVGGTDQKFNMLAGRELQEKLGQEAQVVITLPILEGVDGVQKMSKSLGNHIGLTEAPEEIFGKIMSIPDALLIKYFKLASTMSPSEIEKIEKELKKGELNPAQAKRDLARSIIEIYYSQKEARSAQDHFDRVFKEQKAPDKIPTVDIEKKELKDSRVWPVKLFKLAGLVESHGEGRRLIEQKGAYINDKAITDIEKNVSVKSGDVLRAGRRKFVRLRIK